MDNGALTSDEPYKGNKRTTRNGKCLIIVQASGRPGELILGAKAEGLRHGETRIRIRS
ncbi:hypothetical protein ACE41H_03325 [Paenibacillus enshidis]|uniref:Glycoside hydrolase family 2 domain-containing protein n=1 Tax=Paenibacillus enshidis TaxID=1458439 RepID=A0ABV5ANP6_9BACL